MINDSSREPEAPVAVVGAGPVGLSLALGLARRGTRSILLERKDGTSKHSKAPGIHIRTREVFRQWGVEGPILHAGSLLRRMVMHNAEPGQGALISLDFEELEKEAEAPGLLLLEQGQTESLLLDAVRESGLCDVRFGAEAVGLVHREDGATLTFREDGATRSVDASFIAGCDGAGSFVRKALGLPFEGRTYSTRPTLADVRITDERDGLPWPRMRNARGGLTFTVRLGPGLWRLIRLEGRDPEKGDDVPEEELRDLVGEVLGPGPVEHVWASRFRIHRRSAPRFRVGRVLLAGDAAHIHSPAGGLGMNSGIQDAHNLAWKLDVALRGGDVDRLLDSYDVERRAVVVGSVSAYADFLTRGFLQAPPMVRAISFFLLRAALRVPRLRKPALRRMTMIDLGYSSSPLLEQTASNAGVRLPDPLLRSPEGEELRLHDLLPYGPVLLGIGDALPPPPEMMVEKIIRIGDGGHREPAGSLRALLGGRDGWILVRPDQHIAWSKVDLEGCRDRTARALGWKS